MAKTMAVITDGVVTNMIWCSDTEEGSETLLSPGEMPVGIGDTYEDGKFYRDGVEVLTPLEEAQKQLQDLQAQLDGLTEAYVEGVNSL